VVAGVSTFAGNPVVGVDEDGTGEIVNDDDAGGFCGRIGLGTVWANPGERASDIKTPTTVMASPGFMHLYYCMFRMDRQKFSCA
jgi:hypothetical protein